MGSKTCNLYVEAGVFSQPIGRVITLTFTRKITSMMIPKVHQNRNGSEEQLEIIQCNLKLS